MLMTRSVVWMFSVGLMLLGAGVVSGQAYPNKPIRIVTSEPGGGGDFTARLIAQGISGPVSTPRLTFWIHALVVLPPPARPVQTEEGPSS